MKTLLRKFALWLLRNEITQIATCKDGKHEAVKVILVQPSQMEYFFNAN